MISTSTLEQEYAEATKKARRLVASRYPVEECEPASPDYPVTTEPWREVWSITIPIPQNDLRCLLAIPYTFPDQLPKVYVLIKAAEDVGEIPHLDKKRSLCTFDPAEVVLNPYCHPGEIVLEVVKQAERLWLEGKAGTNYQDYYDEFEAYWAQGVDSRVIALIQPKGNAREVVAIPLKPKWNEASWLLTEQEAEGKRWLGAIGHPNSNGECIPALYLPLIDLGIPPFPTTNKEIYQRLSECDPQALKKLLKFLGQQKRPTVILFSVPASPMGRAMGAWSHQVFYHEINRGPGDVLRMVGFIPGFRPGHRAAKMELTARHGNKELERSIVVRANKERLFNRTAGNSPRVWNHPVNIIGCGSIGSLLAENLGRSGQVDYLRLIDPDYLTIENVPRHLCGLSAVGMPKAVALVQELGRHFPFIQCEPHEKNILELIRTTPSVLEPASLCIVAIGVDAVERRINQLFWNATTGWDHPICFVWVEPYLYGGHALYLHKGLSGCFECCFDQQLLYKHRVIQNPRYLLKREAGCQSTYMPYSGADALQFVAALTRFLLSSNNTTTNTRFTWVGDLDEAHQKGLTIQPEWFSTTPFSTHIRVIETNPSCPVCVR